MHDDDRYTVISADCHAGADLRDYKPYLESRYHDRFDDWADHYVSPFEDLSKPEAVRNWDSDRRLGDLEADGVVAEVIYPNTVPPFFPGGNLTALVPSAADFELRLAGLRAHNRWLAEFCAAAPGRRAGIGQFLLNDVDEAVHDVNWMADNGLKGVLLPGAPPGAPIEPLQSHAYDPVWRACEERGVVINTHGGELLPGLRRIPEFTTLVVDGDDLVLAPSVLDAGAVGGIRPFPRSADGLGRTGKWLDRSSPPRDGRPLLEHGRGRDRRTAELGRDAPLPPAE